MVVYMLDKKFHKSVEDSQANFRQLIFFYPKWWGKMKSPKLIFLPFILAIFVLFWLSSGIYCFEKFLNLRDPNTLLKRHI